MFEVGTNAAVNVNSVTPLVKGRREFEPTQIMRRKFVEYLSTDCFHCCRVPVELFVVSMTNTKHIWKRTKRSTKCMDNFI
jgi:hypothetical protein